MQKNLNIVLRKSTPEDLLQVTSLLESVNLPTKGIDYQFHNFFVTEEGIKIIGCIGLEIYNNIGLLRSLAVHPDKRNYSLGSQLVKKVFELSDEQNLKELYLLTETADKFFPKLGFSVVTRDEVPIEIQNSDEYSSVCGISAIVMKKILI